MKKILLSFAATAFALSLYAAPASACPGHDKTTVTKKEKDDDKATANTADKAKDKDKAKTNKKKEEAKKPAKEKVS
jgi:hypothetical protein